MGRAIQAGAVAIVASIGAISLTAQAAHAAEPPASASPKDYAAELPRIPPVSPAEAVKTFRLIPGFQIELAAVEPRLASPVALDFDEDGRLYIAEFLEYNQEHGSVKQGVGRIRLLEDPDGDGSYDKSTIFLDDVKAPTAVCCYGGGVYVGSVPDILYAKDADGDGKADVRRTVFTGFTRDVGGEAMLNSFRWSFDNRIHVQPSWSGGDVRRADRPEDKPVSVRGRFFVFDPRTEEFDTHSGGGQHGLAIDDWGRTFVNTNSEPVHVFMYDSRYLARNPYLEAPPAMTRIFTGGYTARLFRLSPDEPWRVLRTRWRSQGLEGETPHPSEGDRPSGFFTAASGITAYRGDAWPEEYRGDLFVGEVANNLVFRAKVAADGVGWTASRADPEMDFVASKDVWSRPVQMANGPDGALYVLDMYRNLIQAAAFIPPPILKHLDVSGGFDQGRLYRIVPRDFRRRATPRLSQAPTAELVALLEHANGWHRDAASRLLYERQDAAAVPLLKELAARSTSPLGRMHAIYALQGLQALDVAAVLAGLQDADQRVREHALRLTESFGASPKIVSHLVAMTDDPDPRVRYQLAFTLGEFSDRRSTEALVKLAERDGENSWPRLAFLSSVHGRAGEVFRALLAKERFRARDHGRELLGKLATLIGAARQDGDVAAFAAGLDELPEREGALLSELVEHFAARLSVSGRDRLTTSNTGRAGQALASLLSRALEDASNDQTDVERRVAAIRFLRLLPFDEVRDRAAPWLHFRQPQSVQAATMELLSRFDEPAVPQLLISAWQELGPQSRASAAETLFSRPEWTLAFLQAIDQNAIRSGDVDLTRIRALRDHENEAIRELAARLADAARPAGRAEVVAAYRRSLELPGDKLRGKAIFKKDCSACHQLEGVGVQIGADLSALKGQNAETILLNVLDPNREVKPQFHSYALTTDSGRSLAGMITAETANDLTIRRADGVSETVLRIEIDELESTGMSFMPEGLEKQIDVEAMADLLEYLSSLN